MSLLNRSLAAFRAAAPNQDALTVGAAAFFEIPYDEVTPDQRAAWKHMTSAIRYDNTFINGH